MNGLRLSIFFKIFVIAMCISLLYFAFMPEATLMLLLKMIAVGMVISVAAGIVYPEVRGIRDGDMVSVVYGTGIPALIGKPGRAMEEGKKNKQIKVKLNNGNEVLGVIESNDGIITPPKIRIVYEERLVE